MTTSKAIQAAREFLFGRQKAYQRTFMLENRDSAAVLDDLAKFCRAHETTFHTDDRIASLMEGRREVWLRIQQHIQLTDEQLWKLYHKGE